jgi:hypothetical protein
MISVVNSPDFSEVTGVTLSKEQMAWDFWPKGEIQGKWGQTSPKNTKATVNFEMLKHTSNSINSSQRSSGSNDFKLEMG